MRYASSSILSTGAPRSRVRQLAGSTVPDSENDIAVPHGHHKNLHLTQSFSGQYGINFDIDFNLLTQRCLKDFVHGGYPQTDFMEGSHVHGANRHLPQVS